MKTNNRSFSQEPVSETGEPLTSSALFEAFQNPPREYGEVPFWWWSGDKLDKARIGRQLEELHRKGVAGTQVNYCHLRSHGWVTMAVEPDIFSDEWWDVFAYAAEKSRELGMGIGLSCYTLDWPGPDNLFRKLGITSPETRGSVLELVDGEVVPVRKDNTLDPLNPLSARRVIECFFRPFFERVGERAAEALNYFFQDELRLCGNVRVWSDDFAAEFRRRKGYDITSHLKLLFDDGTWTEQSAKIRLDYNDVMVALTEERYFRPIYDFFAAKGKIYACDPMTRGKNPCEFGDYMRCMRWYTAPGFDTPGKDADPVKCKMGSSIAHLYRRPRVWLEGYHSLGWQASPETIFAATVRNYAYGANLLNLHGLYYSTYGGWWEWAPPCYHFHQPYWALMEHFLGYFTRLSYLLTRGAHVADVAIVTPQEPVVVEPWRAGKSVQTAHETVIRLATEESIDCDFIDADSLAAAIVAHDELGTVLKAADERYRVIVLPGMFVMRDSSRRKIAEFEEAGGRVLRIDSAAEFVFPSDLPRDVEGNRGLKVCHRRTSDCDIYFLVDWDGKTPIRLRSEGELEFWDPWTGERRSEPPASGPVLAVIKREAGKPRAIVEPVSRRTIATIPVAGEWIVEYLPTLDNSDGDYRLPATGETIGPEVTRMLWIEENREQTLGFAPQFLADGSAEPFEFSWRYGVFGKPGDQDNYHGLNRRVTGDFFLLGPYDVKYFYDMDPKAGDRPPRKIFRTGVYAAEPTAAKVIASGTPPFTLDNAEKPRWPKPVPTRLKLGGRDVRDGETVTLPVGYTELEVEYNAFGRAMVVLDAKPEAARRPPSLSSPYCDEAMPGRLLYDPYMGKYRTGTFTASVPPGTYDAEVEVYGEVLEKKIEHGLLTVKTAFVPGRIGGGAFKGPIRLNVRPAATPLGDWARYEGLRTYSGGARYATTFQSAPLADGVRAVLSLGRVGSVASVRLNGGKEHVLMTAPWEVEFAAEELRAGENRLEVTVYNTLNNYHQTTPSRYKVSVEEAPSGLMGPVVVKFVRAGELR